RPHPHRPDPDQRHGRACHPGGVRNGGPALAAIARGWDKPDRKSVADGPLRRYSQPVIFPGGFHMSMHRLAFRAGCGLVLTLAAAVLLSGPTPAADKLEVHNVEGQPLGENARRLLDAFDFLGTPLPTETADALKAAIKDRDAEKLQKLLDPNVLV